MSKVVKAKVLQGRYAGEVVRVSNVSLDEMGRQRASCLRTDGSRANIPVADLESIQETATAEPAVRKAKTASMPFISGSSSSRTLTHTKNMAKPKLEVKTPTQSSRKQIGQCENCGAEYNLEERKGMAGKLTQCETCAEEVENKVQGRMIFSHKTGATIEIKKDGELKHEAETFNVITTLN